MVESVVFIMKELAYEVLSGVVIRDVEIMPHPTMWHVALKPASQIVALQLPSVGGHDMIELPSCPYANCQVVVFVSRYVSNTIFSCLNLGGRRFWLVGGLVIEAF